MAKILAFADGNPFISINHESLYPTVLLAVRYDVQPGGTDYDLSNPYQNSKKKILTQP
ncbi:hypothetical protein MTsPCn5_04140 [Croceitalea sp. MTPC5]|uniref:hypothetical protein n=1 Tax=Croceitalea sp. MTPC5 TaxID=3056565 RepID=UPI002B3D7CB5|nr:hypothetical protein MTsPCn5_04140 [Croceitalea sp. MTPC5]